MLKRIGAALALLAFCVISVLRIARPPAPVPATAADTVFSAERAMHHVEAIAVRPHPVGTAEHDRVRDYIVGQLAGMGIRARIQNATGVSTRGPEVGRVQNVLAWMPGSDPNGKALLLAAHYDGVEAGPAASDDGAGVGALLETLRALHARRRPLAHDVIVLFSDGEEAGMLGAAAFVREHEWAKDVAMVLNFEARGTTGRSVMFETGPGNLDAARLLRRAPGVTAGSVFTTIYRALPNDTDLSEFQPARLPGLNFAFADGVQRYHTSIDDVAHLDPGSVQHHGSQMLALATTIADGPLPRPTTGDAVFFDLPLLGLVVYPVGMAIPLLLIALVLVAVAVVPRRAGLGAGVATAVVAVVACALVGIAYAAVITGAAVWSGVYAASVALVALAVVLGCAAAAARWASTGAVHMGALVLWAVIAAIVTISAPSASYLFVWPLLFVAAAEAVRAWKPAHTAAATALAWIGVAVTLLILAGLVYGAVVIMLGVAGAGAVIVALFTSLIVLLLLPHLTVIAGGARWYGAPWLAAAGLVLLAAGALFVRPTRDRPTPSSLVYAENADSSDAWLGTPYAAPDPWTASAIAPRATAPAWTKGLALSGNRFSGRRVERVALDAPRATLVRDTVINGARRVVFRVTAAGTTGLVMRAVGARVLTSSIDGRIVDTTRNRYQQREWAMQYAAVPDSGAIVALSIPLGAHIELQLSARRPGIPAVPGLHIAPRPANVVPMGHGDVNVVYRAQKF